MSLVAHEFLREHSDEILHEWESLVVAHPDEVKLANSVLRDHLPEFLEGLAHWLEHGGEPGTIKMRAVALRHAVDRLEPSYQISQVIREFRLLHTTILRLLLAADDAGQHGTAWMADRAVDLARLNAGLDLAVSDIVQAFIAARDRRDTTERKRARKAVEESARRLQLHIQSTPVAVVEWDDQFRVTAWNPAAEAIFGWSAEEAMGKHASFIFAASARAHVDGVFRQLLDQKGGTRSTNENITKDGRIITCDWNNAALISSSGGVIGVASMALDITDMKAMQAQLMQSDRLASMGLLAAGVAHEINNPLAYAIAALDFLVREFKEMAQRLPGQPLDELQQALAEARDGAGRVWHVVRDLKTFSRMDEGHCATVELRPIIESSINMVFNEIKYRARLVKEYGKIPPVLANEARLGQVFLNLLVNAAQAIPEGCVDENEIRVTTRTDELGRAIVEVRDSGSGIPSDVVRRIFDPFFTTKPIGVGTGLGLSICRNIITAIGGEIIVDSQVNEGTVFSVALPPAPPVIGIDGAARTATATVKQGRRGRVLVVDDEPAIGRCIRRLLISEHEVLALTSANEALEHFAHGERFDVILCDLMMPKMTGIELYAELKRMAPDQAERMIVLTGGAFTPRAQQFLDSVPNLRVEKPFDSVKLQAMVRSWVR
jgi:two-component system cell cycle sensor histidine kinase/response regulator CckA